MASKSPESQILCCFLLPNFDTPILVMLSTAKYAQINSFLYEIDLLFIVSLHCPKTLIHITKGITQFQDNGSAKSLKNPSHAQSLPVRSPYLQALSPHPEAGLYKTPSVRLLLHTTRAVMSRVTSTGTAMNGARMLIGGSWRSRPVRAQSWK